MCQWPPKLWSRIRRLGLSIKSNSDEDPSDRHHQTHRGKRSNIEMQSGSDKDHGGLKNIPQSNAEGIDGRVRFVLRFSRSRQQQRLPYGVLQRIVRGVLANLQNSNYAKHGIGKNRYKGRKRKRWKHKKRSAHSDAFEDTRNQETLNKKAEKVDPPVVIRIESPDVGFSRVQESGGGT